MSHCASHRITSHHIASHRTALQRNATQRNSNARHSITCKQVSSSISHLHLHGTLPLSSLLSPLALPSFSFPLSPHLLFFTSSLLHFFTSSPLHFCTSALLHFFTSSLLIVSSSLPLNSPHRHGVVQEG